MTFTPGTKVRFKAPTSSLDALDGLEGTVAGPVSYSVASIEVTKNSDSGQHGYLVGAVADFSLSNLVAVEDAPQEWKVGDRVKVNDEGNSTHDGLVGTVTEIGSAYGKGTVKADIDESCEAFKKLKAWNTALDGKDWYLRTATLELLEEEEEEVEEKPLVGGAISYGQVERGQRIRVSYESNGVVYSREGIVGMVSNNRTYSAEKENWTINVLDDEAERWGGKGKRLNWGSDNQKETIELLEAAPEVDEVLERLLESKGGTVIRAFHNPEFLVREPFSDGWKNPANQRVYTSEFVRRNAGDKITFFVEDTEGN